MIAFSSSSLSLSSLSESDESESESSLDESESLEDESALTVAVIPARVAKSSQPCALPAEGT